MVATELLTKFKLAIGDLSPTNELDDYYKGFLATARVMLESNDISAEQLDDELGKSAIVLYAKALLEKEDVATNPTLILLRNTLSSSTKGDRCERTGENDNGT